MSDIPSTITIRHTLASGDADRIIRLHVDLYSKEYGFDASFGTHVAKPLAEFIASNSERERIWLLESDHDLLGCIAIVKHSDSEAQLRWFLLHPSLRGRGLGDQLAAEAIQFCRDCAYERVFLWTVNLLEVAAKVYRKHGFIITEEQTHTIWGCALTEQRYDLVLHP